MPSLTDYLAAQDETQTAFAARAGLTDSTLSRLLKGRNPPSPEVVERVHVATDGQVTANDLFDAWRTARNGAEGATSTVSAGEGA
jgi:transcriptional regulator with XRE-family HTH domain